MKDQTDISKVVKQHTEIDNFFSGGFAVRKPNAKQNNKIPAGNKKALTDIAQQINKCRSCQLGSQRTNPVPGEGLSSTRLVFVGEAPGADEDKQGKPFVGKSGKLLDNIIKAMGLTRNDVYICNILKCRPPENRDPNPEEIIKCMPFLQQQLEIIQPEVIVALGAHAARTLLKSEKTIGKLRGQFHDFILEKSNKTIMLMPTYHPSYLVRNYSHENRKRVWEDMKKVIKKLNP